MGDDRFVPSVGDNALQMQEKEKTKCYIVGPAESNSFFFIRRSNGVKKKET